MTINLFHALIRYKHSSIIPSSFCGYFFLRILILLLRICEKIRDKRHRNTELRKYDDSLHGDSQV